MAEQAPAVSVLLSVWNGMPFVVETIDSVVAQTFENWELIINDNCSTDDTLAVLQERAASDPRITVLASTENRGCAGGYNHALAHARAPWVAIIDADDRALPERLERQLAFVEEHPDVKVASTLAYYINADGERVAKTHHDLTSPEAFRRYMDAEEPIGILNPGAMIERATMVSLGGYRQEFFPAEDSDLWARMSEHGMILVQPEYLMEYRVHAGSSVTQAFRDSQMKFAWAWACARARRSGNTEPSWEEFLVDWRSQSRIARLRRWQMITAKGMYRAAAFEWTNHRRPTAVVRAATSFLLKPGYFVGRWRQQTLSRRPSPG